MLEVKNISASYGGAVALKNVSLKIAEGEIVSIIGANGAGKTTTLRVISGLLRPANGQILLEGINITGMEPFELASLGLIHVPEGRGLFSDMTVKENLEMGAYLQKSNAEQKNLLNLYILYFPYSRKEKNN
jgi:branched-chain amino acid transport system ATP-binding protein